MLASLRASDSTVVGSPTESPVDEMGRQIEIVYLALSDSSIVSRGYIFDGLSTLYPSRLSFNFSKLYIIPYSLLTP